MASLKFFFFFLPSNRAAFSVQMQFRLSCGWRAFEMNSSEALLRKWNCLGYGLLSRSSTVHINDQWHVPLYCAAGFTWSNQPRIHRHCLLFVSSVSCLLVFLLACPNSLLLWRSYKSQELLIWLLHLFHFSKCMQMLAFNKCLTFRNDTIAMKRNTFSGNFTETCLLKDSSTLQLYCNWM